VAYRSVNGLRTLGSWRILTRPTQGYVSIRWTRLYVCFGSLGVSTSISSDIHPIRRHIMQRRRSKNGVIQVTWTTFSSGERMCSLGEIPLAHNPCVSSSNLFRVPPPLSDKKLSLRVCLSLISVFNPILHQHRI
jgi:hypothetical protein